MDHKLLADAEESRWLSDMPTLAHVLQRRSKEQPDRVLYRFLDYVQGDAPIEATLTCGELDRRARAIAALLQGRSRPGDRALLLYPTGLDYVSAFMGCLYAGVIAVPAYPPEYHRLLARIGSIAADSRPSMVLTTSRVLRQHEGLQDRGPGMTGLHWAVTDDELSGVEHLWREPSISAEDLSFLQYTSGSSGNPKGVMVSHANLIDNLMRLRRGFGYSSSDCHVTWLPPYHDMGLIVALLSAIYNAYSCVLMSPFAFLQSPWRWLHQVSARRGTVIGAPNFAYDLCVRKIPPERRADLDLSSLRMAFCGAEPVRAQTIERFSSAFAPCGLRPEVFSPAYGLAESTVFVSVTRGDQRQKVLEVDRDAYGRGSVAAAATSDTAMRVVSCGECLDGHDVVIVDPERRRLCGEDEIGEIWISGPSVARGYWQDGRRTEEVFNASLTDPELAHLRRGPFLRTGDLGFFRDGQLYISGRVKDVIILRGVNHYPQDIECAAEASHPALRQGCSAAFTIDNGQAEQVVIVHEVIPGEHDADAVFSAVRMAVREQHDVVLSEIVLIEPNSIPKTTSGKIARRPTRDALLKGDLPVKRRWSGSGAS